MEPQETPLEFLEKLERTRSVYLDDRNLIQNLALLKKRVDDTAKDISEDDLLIVIRKMDYFALSPQKFVRDMVMKITTVCLNSLTIATIHRFFPIYSIPILSIDTKSLLKKYLPYHLKDNLYDTLHQIIQLFESDAFDQDGGHLYEALLKEIDGDFVFWRDYVCPMFKIHMGGMQSRGPFYQSLVKYWIPKSLNAFGTQVIDEFIPVCFRSNFKLHLALTHRRYGLDVGYRVIEELCHFSMNTLICREPELTMSIVSISNMKILNRIDILKEDFKYFRVYMNTHRPRLDIGVIRKFIQKIFASGHIHRTNEKFRQDLLECLFFIYEEGFNYIRANNEIGGLIINSIWKYALGDSNELKVENFPSSMAYGNGENALYKYLTETDPFKWWLTNMSSSNAGLHLCRLFPTCQLNSLCDLVSEHHPNVPIIIHREIMEELNRNCIDRRTLFDIHNLITYHRAMNRVHGDRALEQQLRFLREQHNLNSTNMSTQLVLDTLFVQLASLMDEDFNPNLFMELFRLCSLIIREKLHHPLHSPLIKMYERQMIDTFAQVYRFKNIGDLEHIAGMLVAILQECDMKRPTVEAAKALKLVSKRLGKDNPVKINLLRETIVRLTEPDHFPISNIRKNPQSRLVIHALSCPVDNDSDVLEASIERLMGLIRERNPSTNLAHTFHSLEMLMNDVELHTHTFKYIGDLIMLCITHFPHRQYSLQSVILQLYAVLLGRVLGANTADGRYYSFGDVYQLYKPIFKNMIHFCLNFSGAPGIRLIIQFFSEGCCRYEWFEDFDFKNDIGVLKDVFLRIRVTHRFKDLRMQAAKAFASCLSFEEIYPTIIYMFSSDKRHQKEHEAFIMKLLDRYQRMHTYVPYEQKVAILRTVCAYIEEINRYRTRMTDWFSILIEIFYSISMDHLTILLSLVSFQTSECQQHRDLIELANVPLIIQEVAECEFMKENIMVLVYVIQSRINLVTSENARKIVNSLILLALVDTFDWNKLHCADIVDYLLEKFKNIEFSPVVFRIVSQINLDCSKEIIHEKSDIWLTTLVKVASGNLPRSDVEKMFYGAKGIALGRGVTYSDRIFLSYTLRLCKDERNYTDIFLSFMTIFVSSSSHVAIQPVFRLFNERIHKREQGISVLMDYDKVKQYLSVEGYLRYLNSCSRLLQQSVDRKDRSRETEDSSLDRKMLLVCYRLIEEYQNKLEQQ